MRVHFTLDGPVNGSVVVLHSSLGCTGAMWDMQLPTLIGAGLRVLRYDYRGHGRSDTASGAYTLGELGDDVLELMGARSIDRAVHVGLSLGGMVSMWLAENAPDAVSGLVLCSTSADLQPSSAWTERAELVRERGTGVMALALVPRWFSADFIASHPELVEQFRDQIRSTSPDGFAGCCDAIAAMDLLGGLSAITVPTAVLVGLQGPGTPVEHAKQIAAAIPAASLTVLDPGAHLLNVERPNEVSAAILSVVSQVG